MSTRVTKILRATAMMLIAAAAVPAQSQLPEPQGLVNDFAGKLSDPTKQQLENLLVYFRNRSDIEIAVVTVPFDYLANQPIEAYSLQLGREWKIGGKEGALILLLAIKPKSADGRFSGATRLEVGRKLEKDIPNELAGEIIKKLRGDLQQGRFDEAVTQGVHRLIGTLAEKRGISMQGLDTGGAPQADQPSAARVENASPASQQTPLAPNNATHNRNQSPQKNGWPFSTVLILIVGLPLFIISFIAVVFLRAMAKLNRSGKPTANPNRHHFFAPDHHASSQGYASNTSSWNGANNSSGFSDSGNSSGFSDSGSASSWGDSGSVSSSDSSSPSSGSDFGGGGASDSW